MLIFIGLHNTALVERPIHMWLGGAGGGTGALEPGTLSENPMLSKVDFFFLIICMSLCGHVQLELQTVVCGPEWVLGTAQE